MLSSSGCQAALAEQLQSRYLKFHQSARLPRRLALKASPPLLVFPHERWNSARVKLLIIGQETRHWTYNPADIGDAGDPIENFRDFSRAEQGVGAMSNLYRWYSLGRAKPKLNSPFWRGFRALDAAINGGGDAALWTNIFKVNVNGSVMKNCRAAEVSALQRAQKGLLVEEVKLLKPDIVVFLTGPRYDSAIRCEFPDMEISALSRRVSESSVGIIRAEGLPARTIRTYHPEYLQRSRQLGLLSVVSSWAGKSDCGCAARAIPHHHCPAASLERKDMKLPP